MARHILKMEVVQTLRRMLATITLVNKYKIFKEIDGGQSCIATAKKYDMAKNTVSHWLKKIAEIFKAVSS